MAAVARVTSARLTSGSSTSGRPRGAHPVLIAPAFELRAPSPVAAALGPLPPAQLYVTGFITGVLTVFFDVAYQSYLPALVEREQLVDGNAKLELTRSGAQLSGPALGGLLVGTFGAATAMTAD